MILAQRCPRIPSKPKDLRKRKIQDQNSSPWTALQSFQQSWWDTSPHKPTCQLFLHIALIWIKKVHLSNFEIKNWALKLANESFKIDVLNVECMSLIVFLRKCEFTLILWIILSVVSWTRSNLNFCQTLLKSKKCEFLFFVFIYNSLKKMNKI